MRWIIALIAVAGACKGVTDILAFPVESSMFSGWWSAGQNYGWAESFPWLLRPAAYVVVDAWHLFDAVRILALCVAVWVALSLPSGTLSIVTATRFSAEAEFVGKLPRWWWIAVFWGVHQASFMLMYHGAKAVL